MGKWDVIIVGAGPAGLNAAIACAEHGLRVLVLDEFIKPGGRLLGQLHQEPDGKWWNGMEEARKLHEKALALDIQIKMGASVYDIVPSKGGWLVYADSEAWHTPFLLLATGAAESASPIPGWTLPGVMSIGAAQVMTNVHRVPVGKRGVIVGMNVLSVAIARELQLAGIEVAAMVLPANSLINQQAANPMQVMESMLRLAHLAPSPFIRLGAKLMRSDALRKIGLRGYPRRGLRMWDIPMQLRQAAIAVEGKDQVERIRLAPINIEGQPNERRAYSLEVDFVCISGGLYPLAELAAVAGCPFRYIPELGGHVPVHNEQMQTPVAGLFVAGNITGIESASIAMTQGTVAGLSIVKQQHMAENNKPALIQSIQNQLEQAINDVKQARAHAVLQFHPDIQAGRQQMAAYWSS